MHNRVDCPTRNQQGEPLNLAKRYHGNTNKKINHFQNFPIFAFKLK